MVEHSLKILAREEKEHHLHHFALLVGSSRNYYRPVSFARNVRGLNGHFRPWSGSHFWPLIQIMDEAAQILAKMADWGGEELSGRVVNEVTESFVRSVILFSCLFTSLWPFQVSRFLIMFFRFYLCHIGPFNYISLYESLLQPWYNP